MSQTTTTRVRIRADFNRACENAAAAYDRSDSANYAYWCGQRDRYERLLSRIA